MTYQSGNVVVTSVGWVDLQVTMGFNSNLWPSMTCLIWSIPMASRKAPKNISHLPPVRNGDGSKLVTSCYYILQYLTHYITHIWGNITNISKYYSNTSISCNMIVHIWGNKHPLPRWGPLAPSENFDSQPVSTGFCSR